MGALERTRIGTTGVEGTRVALGTAPVGGRARAGPGEQAVATIERAWEQGVRYFDTAPYYGLGLSEQITGEVLRRKPREELVLSTKVGRLLMPGQMQHPFF